MSKEYYIGIDIGGTKILSALADSEGNIINKAQNPTEADKGEEVIIANIKDSINRVIKNSKITKDKVRRIGVGSPGPLDLNNGIIIENSNLAWTNVPIVQILEDDTGIDVILENDANAAALGENQFGAGKEADDMIYITISTGIGGGIIINRKIFHGGKGNAGEVGHMTLIPDSDYQCGCGNYGCFEAVASGTAIARRGREALTADKDGLIYEYSEGNPDLVDAPLIAAAARKGDQKAIDIYKITGQLLGVGIANVVNLFDPEIIVLGGGVMHAKDLFWDELENSLHERALQPNLKGLQLKEVKLGKDTGVKGAIAVAMCDYLY
ncbi:MAG TPA: ROK family protein [Halanaerobiales bacterium]|nr:ROK family protein [Halanaerobiales bacterium]